MSFWPPYAFHSQILPHNLTLVWRPQLQVYLQNFSIVMTLLISIYSMYLVGLSVSCVIVSSASVNKVLSPMNSWFYYVTQDPFWHNLRMLRLCFRQLFGEFLIEWANQKCYIRAHYSKLVERWILVTMNSGAALKHGSVYTMHNFIHTTTCHRWIRRCKISYLSIKTFACLAVEYPWHKTFRLIRFF